MSLLKQIDDKGAVLAWSPLQTYGNFVALGTKVGSVYQFNPWWCNSFTGLMWCRIPLELVLMIMEES